MTAVEYAETVAIYCKVTGAGPGVAETLSLHHRTIVGKWRATGRELGEVAYRLAESKDIPTWPNEHLKAIGSELDRLRAEQAIAQRPKRTEHECLICDGIGLVIVPHPCCIFRGKITGFYDARAKIRRRDVVTIAVICTAPKCWAGERQLQSNRNYADESKKPRLLTMDGYLRRVGNYIEPTVLLREWELEQAAKSRSASPREENETDVFRSLVGKILERQREWVETPYHDEAEVDDVPA